MFIWFKVVFIVLFFASNAWAIFPPINWEDVNTDDFPTKIIIQGDFIDETATGLVLTFPVDTGGGSGSGDLKADGSVPMTANWDIGNYDITLKSLLETGQ